MNLFRTITAIALFVIAVSFISCATSSPASKKKKTEEKAAPSVAESSVYPQWYDRTQSVISDDSHGYNVYSTALAGDSARAVRKAVNQAQAELKAGIANRLEAIRNHAATELGGASGLNTPEFIFALRRAENIVSDIAKTKNVAVEPNKYNASYRAFAEITVDKKELVGQLGRTFSGHKKAWNAMKESQAFTRF